MKQNGGQSKAKLKTFVKKKASKNELDMFEHQECGKEILTVHTLHFFILKRLCLFAFCGY